MFWLVGIIVGIGAAIGTLRWALREHRAERKPWLDLLGSSAVDGIADDGAGTIPPLTAPFTGRPCLGYLLEIVVEEPNVNEKTFYRAFTDGGGQLALRGHDGRPLGRFDLGGGGIIFPTPLEEYGKYSSSLTNETVFHGTMDRAPWQLAAFVQRLDPGVQELVWRPSQMLGGKRVYFNERIGPADRRRGITREGGAWHRRQRTRARGKATRRQRALRRDHGGRHRVRLREHAARDDRREVTRGAVYGPHA